MGEQLTLDKFMVVVPSKA